MDEVARACELGKGTLYLYFQSKNELAFALLVRATEDLLKVLSRSIDPSMRAVDQLGQLALAYYGYADAQPEAFRYMFVTPHRSYVGRAAPHLLEAWAEASRAALELVADVLQRAEAEGDIVVGDPWSTAVSMWSALTGVIVIPAEESRAPFLGNIDRRELVVATLQRAITGMRPPAPQPHAPSSRAPTRSRETGTRDTEPGTPTKGEP